ncbi:MAG: long-chain fatty acid--CoA ligase [Phycisphaerales bacterium]|nr:long-chain fatty acid--CoA ligase [Phycisphaerales bacterium]
MASVPSTFPALLRDVVAKRSATVFLPRRRATDPRPVTFGDLLRDVDALATALLGHGVRRGDRVGVIAENRYEWLLIDQALASLGAISVPRGVDTTPKELAFLLRHSGCTLAFADDDRVGRDLLALRGELPALRSVVVMQDRTEVAGAQALGDLLREGAATASARAEVLAAARAEVQPDDLLTIVYTSGTTAEPKGVMLTHRNVLTNLAVVTDVLHVTDADSFLSVLPAWHMYERIMDYLALATGAQLVYTDRRRIKEDLAGVKPTVFAAVPRIWEMLHDGLVGHAQKLPGLKGKLLRRGLALSRLVGGGRARLDQRLVHALLDRIVLKKVRATLGGRLRLCVSGGGALPRHVDETMLGLGLPLKNGYGLTETSPVASVRLPHQRTPGHIGPPLPQTQIEARTADGTRCAVGATGVLWIRGPQVMRGYYDNQRRTAEVLTADGWFCSGDLGHVDAAGNVWITGRAKDTIVLAGGENVEPEPVEAVIKTSPFVEQAVVLGQDQKALGALLVPRVERLEQQIPRAQWDVRDGELHGREVHALLRRELDRVLVRDNGIRPCDRVAQFRVLAEPLTPENGLLTQTLKVRRHVVVERFAPLLAALFAGHRGD